MICKVCGSTYEGRSYSKYCSVACKNVGNREASRRFHEAVRKGEHLIPAKGCKACGKEFHPRNYHQIYCSRMCLNIAHSQKKPRKFTDATITAVAGAMVKGESPESVGEVFGWSMDAFKAEYKKYEKKIKQRMNYIQTRRNMPMPGSKY